MIPSYPAPPLHSWRHHLRRSAVVSRFVAVLLVTAVSVRFAIGGLERALGVSRANFVVKPLPHPAAALGAAPATPRVSASPSSARDGPRKPGEGPAGGAGQPLSIALGITAGPPRSEVYVNGRLVGHTPFLGDTSCKSGLPLRVDVVPEKGVPLSYVRECRGRTLEITGPPP
jgi:hypothetical protein